MFLETNAFQNEKFVTNSKNVQKTLNYLDYMPIPLFILPKFTEDCLKDLNYHENAIRS